MEGNMTDKVRNTMRWLWVATVAVALVVWAWTALKGAPVDLATLLPLIGPLTAALGLAEASNGVKRATSNPEVILAERGIPE